MQNISDTEGTPGDERLFTNISEYVSANHLSGSERKRCSRKTLAGRCEIEQGSPGSEYVVLTRHRTPGISDMGRTFVFFYWGGGR